MGFTERFIIKTSENLIKRIETKNTKETLDIATWQKYTLEFLNSPFELIIGNEEEYTKIIFDFKESSSQEKAKKMSILLDNPKTINDFYEKACFDIHKKHNFEGINCVSYAAFVSTFSQYMNPENETHFLGGTAIMIEAPNKKEIGKVSQHFWVTINGQLFDNSGLEGYSYANHKPRLEINNTLPVVNQ